MLDNVTVCVRKSISVAMALLLATLLVPIVPRVNSAHAAEGAALPSDFIEGSKNTEGLVTSGILNNYHAPGKVTFEQVFDVAKIDTAIDKESLLKPTVESDDATLKDEATTAAKAIVTTKATEAAALAAETHKQANAATWETDAQTAGQLLAEKTFKENEAEALAQATKKAEEAIEILKQKQPDVVLDEVVLNKKTSSTDVDVQVDLGSPTWAVAQLAATPDDASVQAVANTTSLTYKFGSMALAFGSVASDNESVIKDVTAAGTTATRTLEILAAGEVALDVPFSYNWLVTGGPYSFTYDYEYSYKPNYSYPECTYTYGYTYRYTDGSNPQQEVDTEKVEQAKLGDVPSGVLDNLTQTETEDSVSSDGTFTCEYDPQAGKPPLASTYDYSIKIDNLFSGSAIAPVTHEFLNDDAFTYNDSSKTINAFGDNDFTDTAAALAFLGAPAITKTNGFSVAYKDGQLEVTPENATAPEGEKVEVTWTLPDATQVVHTVQVVVNPLEITYAAIEQPFRLKADQETHILTIANENVKKAIESATGEQIAADYYQSVELDASYDGQGAAIQSRGLTFSNKMDSKQKYANYAVVDAGAANILKMEQLNWQDTGLLLAATNGTSPVTLSSENAATQWINSTPSASWAQHELAYATKGVPAEKTAFNSSELSGGDGTHEVELYAMDEDDVVRAVNDITYMIDTQIPILSGAQASAPQKSATFGGILFGDTFVNVDLSVIDEARQNQSESKDPLKEIKASGVDTGKTKAWYTDIENDQTDVEAELKGEAPLYSFTIEGSKDVSTSSIKVQAVDVAGNVMDTTADKSRDIPIEYSRLVADASAPKIAIDWDTYNVFNERYYNTNRTMTLTIEEEFFNYTRDYMNDQVITTIFQNEQAVIAVHPSDFVEVEKNVWQYSLSFTVDADWDVAAPSIYDIVGRAASVAGDSFTVDKTNPTMDVAFDNNNVRSGNYYNAARTATITVVEHNFNGSLIHIAPTATAGNGDATGSPSISGWSSSGDTHTASVSFPGEGVYSMTIDGMDSATNTLSSYSCPEFVVDTVKPQINLSMNGNNAEGTQAYGDTAGLQVSVHDTNVDGGATASSITQIGYSSILDAVNSGSGESNYYQASAQASASATEYSVNYPDPAKETANDGVYNLVVTATDLAGNSDSKALSWSVNRFGSTYMLGNSVKSILNSYVNKDKVSDVIITEINPSGHAATAENGKPGAATVELSRDASNKTLAKGSEYDLQEEGTEGQSWFEYTYTVKRANFENDGSYRVLLHSEDRAQNKSENTMADKNETHSGDAVVAFTVDSMDPVCSFVDLDDGKTYSEASHKAAVSINDNIELSSAEIKVNNKTVQSLDKAALDSASVHDFTIQESTTPQTVEVVARDAAGNVGTVSAGGFTVTTDAFTLWWNNKPLVAGSIVGGIVIVVLAATGATLAVRRRKAAGSSSKAS